MEDICVYETLCMHNKSMTHRKKVLYTLILGQVIKQVF